MARRFTIPVEMDEETFNNLEELVIFWRKMTGQHQTENQVINMYVNEAYEKLRIASLNTKKKGL